MALSNAERQRRYIHRLKQSTEGMTPEGVREAMRLWWEYTGEGDPSHMPWDEYVEICRSKRGLKIWNSNLDEMLPRGDHDLDALGDKADMLRRARAILDAVITP